MRKYIIIFLVLCIVCIAYSPAQLIQQYAISTGTYGTGDAALTWQISSTDLVEGIVATLISGGFHSVSVPADDSSRIVTLTDGTFASNGLTVICQDYGSTGTVPGDSNPSLVLEYSLITASSVGLISAFAGHDGNGDRGWINMKVEMDTGSGYTTYYDYLKTGNYGQTIPNTNMVSVVRLIHHDGIIANNVIGVRVSFYNVSHNSIGDFQDPNDNGPPYNNYPNQGTILKEIDIDGPQPPIPTQAPLWELICE